MGVLRWLKMSGWKLKVVSKVNNLSLNVMYDYLSQSEYTAHIISMKKKVLTVRYLPAFCLCFWSGNRFLLIRKTVSFTSYWLIHESRRPQGSCGADALHLGVWGGMRGISGTHRQRWVSCGVGRSSSWQIESWSVSHRGGGRYTVSSWSCWGAPLCNWWTVFMICNEGG